MKRSWIVLTIALGIGAVIFVLVYPRVAVAQSDELAWLRNEFRLEGRQFAEISALHQTYRPVCDQHCADYMAAHVQFSKLLASQQTWTAATDVALRRVFEVERACREDMLKHAFAVSAYMSSDQARRYLVLVQKRALLIEPADLASSSR